MESAGASLTSRVTESRCSTGLLFDWCIEAAVTITTLVLLYDVEFGPEHNDFWPDFLLMSGHNGCFVHCG